MVGPIAAAARGAAKAAAKAGKKAARSAGNKVSRAAKAGDASYNARRRYQRSADRYLKKAENATGSTAEKYRQLARVELENALNTYEQGTTQQFNKSIQGIANRLGVDLDQQRAKMKNLREGTAKRMHEQAVSEQKSASRLLSSMDDDEARRQAEAREIINSKIGSRIIGGLVDVWKDEATVETEDGETEIDKHAILPYLFDYFNVDNLADMLEKVEEIIGDKLYSDEDSEAMYEAVKIMLQKHAVENPVA